MKSHKKDQHRGARRAKTEIATEDTEARDAQEKEEARGAHKRERKRSFPLIKLLSTRVNDVDSGYCR